MKILGWCLLVLLSSSLCLADSEPERPQAEEPKFYDHFLALKRMQEHMASRSPEAQDKLKPQMQQAERRACDRLKKERSEGVPKENYRRQGGDEFLAFSHQFERYCETLR